MIASGVGAVSAATSRGEAGASLGSGTWTVTRLSTWEPVQVEAPSRWRIRETRLLTRLAIARIPNDLAGEDFSASISDGKARSQDVAKVGYRWLPGGGP